MRDSFYALLLRMKYIERWGLMRNSIPENLSEHPWRPPWWPTH